MDRDGNPLHSPNHNGLWSAFFVSVQDDPRRCPVSLARDPEKNILRDMLRLFRKWRLIRRLYKECLRHVTKQGDGWVLMGKQVRVVKGAFAQQTASRFPWKKFWGEEYKSKKLNEINSLLDSCIADGLIDSVRRDGDDRVFIRNSFKGDDFCGYMDFLQEFFTRYDKAWVRIVGIIAPFVAFLAGLKASVVWTFLHQFLGFGS